MVTVLGLVIGGFGSSALGDEDGARTLVGPEFRVSGKLATSGEIYPDVAFDATNDRYLVVWEDTRDVFTLGPDIYSRLVSATGSHVGPDRRINSDPSAESQYRPAVAHNAAADLFLVVWEDGRNYSSRLWDAFARRVLPNGIGVGSDRRVSGLNAISDDYLVAVAANTNSGEYLVVWMDLRNEGSRGREIYGRIVSSAGKLVGGEFRISPPRASADEMFPAVAFNPTANQFLVVWEDTRNEATRGTDIYGRLVSATGSPVGNDFRISGRKATSAEDQPAVSYNPNDGEYLVVWVDGRNFATRSTDIYGRRLSAAGTHLGRDFRVSGHNAIALIRRVAVAYNSGAGEYLVVWHDWRSDATRGIDIYGRRVSRTGSLPAGDFRVAGKKATADETDPAVASNPGASEWLVVWSDYRNQPTRSWDIYARRVAP